MVGSSEESLRICDCFYTCKTRFKKKANTQHHLQIKPTARIALLKLDAGTFFFYLIWFVNWNSKKKIIFKKNYASTSYWKLCFFSCVFIQKNQNLGHLFWVQSSVYISTVCWQLSCTVLMFSSRINQPYTVLYKSMAVENIQFIPCKSGVFWDIQLLFLQQDLYFHLCT